MSWLIVCAVLILIASIPLGVSVRFDQDGLFVRVYTWLFHFTVFPLKPKKQKPQKQKGSPKQSKPETQGAGNPKQTAQKPVQKPAKQGGSLADFLPLVRLGLSLINDFRRKIRMDVLSVKLILGGDDPCDLAVNYGRAWTAIGNLLPLLERVFVIRKRDIEVECDFTSGETLVTARLDISITLGRAVSLGTVYGVRALIEFLKLRKKRKGGVTV